MSRQRLPVRQPGVRRDEAATLATEENRRLVDLVTSLQPAEWARPTDCAEWTVRQMIAHLVGAMEGQASLRELIHQTVAGRRAARAEPGLADLDGMTGVQVREREHLSPDDLVDRLATVAPRAAAARAARPALVRAVRFRQDLPGVGRDRWTAGYLIDVIWTRDAWMHRVDISRATGRPLELTREHDGRIVSDVAHDWAARHGKPVTLTLTGPAGTVVRAGHGGESVTVDAVEFARMVSGRRAGGGLLAQPVPF